MAMEYFERGRAEYLKKRLDFAAVEFLESLRYDPFYGDSHFWLGMTYLAGREFVSALCSLEKASECLEKKVPAVTCGAEKPSYDADLCEYTAAVVFFFLGDDLSAAARFKRIQRPESAAKRFFEIRVTQLEPAGRYPVFDPETIWQGVVEEKKYLEGKNREDRQMRNGKYFGIHRLFENGKKYYQGYFYEDHDLDAVFCVGFEFIYDNSRIKQIRLRPTARMFRTIEL